MRDKRLPLIVMIIIEMEASLTLSSGGRDRKRIRHEDKCSEEWRAALRDREENRMG